MEKITKTKAESLIRGSNGKWFNVVFQKRTDGSIRSLTGRTRVTKYLTGGGPRYDAKEQGLITVFEASKKQYRSVPIEGLKFLTIGNTKYEVM